LACAFILTRVDYCNAVLADLPDSALAPLQRVLHAAARFVADIGPCDYISQTLLSLYWLPVRQRIIYKLRTVMHSVIQRQAPSTAANQSEAHGALAPDTTLSLSDEWAA